MKFKYHYLFFTLLALIAFFTAYSFLCLFAFPDASFPLRKGERVSLLPGETLTQTFQSSRDGLTRLEILFGKFSLEGDAELTLELRDSACSAVLAQKRLSEGSFDSEYTYSFLFDRIPDSQGQTYCFQAHFVTNQPIKKEKSPRFFVDKEAPANPYFLTNPGGQQQGGSGPLAIRPGFTHASFWTNTQEFFDRISQYKPAFLKGWFLIGFATLGLLLTFLSLILLIYEVEKTEESGNE